MSPSPLRYSRVDWLLFNNWTNSWRNLCIRTLALAYLRSLQALSGSVSQPIPPWLAGTSFPSVWRYFLSLLLRGRLTKSERGVFVMLKADLTLL